MGFKLDLEDQLLFFWPVNIIPEMTYNVQSGTLSLYTTYQNMPACLLTLEVLVPNLRCTVICPSLICVICCLQ